MFDPVSLYDSTAPVLPQSAPGLRLLSWNLLRRVGAEAADVARLIESHDVDVALLQEACDRAEDLPALIGGHFHHTRFPYCGHGPAIWSRRKLSRIRELAFDRGAAIRRHALTAEVDGVAVASVHLSHGQLANRRQARQTVETLHGNAVIAGDFNMLGPVRLNGFVEVGPREPTHHARGVLPVRIDRCFVRGLTCLNARALDRGKSDHRPILIDLIPVAMRRAA